MPQPHGGLFLKQSRSQESARAQTVGNCFSIVHKKAQQARPTAPETGKG